MVNRTWQAAAVAFVIFIVTLMFTGLGFGPSVVPEPFATPIAIIGLVAFLALLLLLPVALVTTVVGAAVKLMRAPSNVPGAVFADAPLGSSRSGRGGYRLVVPTFGRTATFTDATGSIVCRLGELAPDRWEVAWENSFPWTIERVRSRAEPWCYRISHSGRLRAVVGRESWWRAHYIVWSDAGQRIAKVTPRTHWRANWMLEWPIGRLVLEQQLRVVQGGYDIRQVEDVDIEDVELRVGLLALAIATELGCRDAEDRLPWWLKLGPS